MEPFWQGFVVGVFFAVILRRVLDYVLPGND